MGTTAGTVTMMGTAVGRLASTVASWDCRYSACSVAVSVGMGPRPVGGLVGCGLLTGAGEPPHASSDRAMRVRKAAAVR